jgi:hypothetical protein
VPVIREISLKLGNTMSVRVAAATLIQRRFTKVITLDLLVPEGILLLRQRILHLFERFT